MERSPGGMHLVLRLPEDVSDMPLAKQVLAKGMPLQALSRRAASLQRQSGLLLSFTNCATTAPGEELGAWISKLLS
ncbi:hypothetical protein AABC73_14435 [Pseudomonas sp. G.S.17]|uniref:hypothetical protein n=1 Tax=Pseudomonas sp. G.S.17 TaxID=3137451 RepID=UPI00311CBD71